jgi:hypothetical protein
LKILIISWYFPPVNTIGALRVGGLARFLIARGHDLGVVAGKNWGQPETLSLGVPLERVAYAKAIDVNALPERLTRILKRGVNGSPAANRHAAEHLEQAAASRDRVSVLRRLSRLYVDLTNLPDNRIGWLPACYLACRRLCRDWHPDLVFASGPPFTALLAARLVSARLGLPFVGELRDRWADDPYEETRPWRVRLNQWLERRALAGATGLVTVTEPWAEFYRRKYGQPVATTYNGYDPLDFGPCPNEDISDPSAPLLIGYAGNIYPGKRDPTPVFEALHLLGRDGENIRVVFRGTDPALVLPLAERAGVAHLIEALPPVPYRQSLEFQRQADVLLLMQWNDPREQGSCPGKLFEYIASLRPVLVLGLADGVPAMIVRERQAGFCSNDAAEIAGQLRIWLRQKQEFGRVPSLPVSAREGLSRTIQFERLERFLLEAIRV